MDQNYIFGNKVIFLFAKKIFVKHKSVYSKEFFVTSQCSEEEIVEVM